MTENPGDGRVPVGDNERFRETKAGLEPCRGVADIRPGHAEHGNACRHGALRQPSRLINVSDGFVDVVMRRLEIACQVRAAAHGAAELPAVGSAEHRAASRAAAVEGQKMKVFHAGVPEIPVLASMKPRTSGSAFPHGLFAR